MKSPPCCVKRRRLRRKGIASFRQPRSPGQGCSRASRGSSNARRRGEEYPVPKTQDRMPKCRNQQLQTPFPDPHSPVPTHHVSSLKSRESTTMESLNEFLSSPVGLVSAGVAAFVI